ncbi:hypothetical protein [Legionella sp. km772]|uniref:hypothetical protein n=1 Tax=Legionella sp. km772 TaxID=2498111 RepID=UPI000F8CA7B5|nr:hypothetical protein [Legionella sp. km772]RUR09434.1 hypothetical protein ELY15_09245 [Legionella sp. km772]
MDVVHQNISSNMPGMIHELAQSLLIIHAYVRGSLERIKNNNLTVEQLRSLFIKVKEQLELMFKLLTAWCS